MSKLLSTFILLLPNLILTQNLPQQLADAQSQKVALEKQMAEADALIETVKLKILQNDLQTIGLPALLPGEEIINHAAMSLVYSEAHEQAKWVAHVITPDIITASNGRSNDFRIDPKIPTGTTIEQDYFLKSPNGEGDFNYDGFGYDRGHLAPSADFRWSKTAVSESFYYSNMSPQLADFNRGIWAKLESNLRDYIFKNPESTLYVVTGGFLSDDLPVIERSINKVAIPEFFWKVAIDPKEGRGIAFLLPNKKPDSPLESYVTTIDKIEELTGINFYHNLPDDQENKLESDINQEAWLNDLQDGNVAALTLKTVPVKRSYPTTFAKKFIQKDIEVTVCGTVVSGRTTGTGNKIINLDKKYPKSIFDVFIRKENFFNFSYDPLDLIGQQICITSTVGKMGQTPAMFIESEEVVQIIEAK